MTRQQNKEGNSKYVEPNKNEDMEKENEKNGQAKNDQKLNIAMGKASLLARIIQKIEEEEAAAAEAAAETE